MAGDDARMERREIALDDVKVGAADAAGEDFEEHFAGLRLRARDVFNGKPGAGCCGLELKTAARMREPSEDKGSAARAAESAKLAERWAESAMARRWRVRNRGARAVTDNVCPPVVITSRPKVTGG